MFQQVNHVYPRAGIHGRVVHEIGQDIVTGRFAQGSKLPNENELIDRFKGSRTAIREAFRVLAAKGLLEARQRAGTHVRSREFWNLCDPDILSWHDPNNLDRASLENLNGLRKIIETEAVRLVSSHQNPTQHLRQIEPVLRNMDKANLMGDPETMRELEQDFHISLVACCGNDYLKSMSGVVRLVMQYCHKQIRSETTSLAGIVRWYMILYEKMRNRDQAGAESAIRALLDRDQESLERSFETFAQPGSEVA